MANNCSINLQGAPSNTVMQKMCSSSSLHVHGLDLICLLLYFRSTLPTNLICCTNRKISCGSKTCGATTRCGDPKILVKAMKSYSHAECLYKLRFALENSNSKKN